MLVGIAALSAWGLYRFNQFLQSVPIRPGADTLAERLIAEGIRYREAYVMQYGDIFTITAIVCPVGAVLALLISGRADMPMNPPTRWRRRPHPADRRADAGSRCADAAISAPRADQTVRVQRQTPGPHRPRADRRRATHRRGFSLQPITPPLGRQQRSTPLRINGGLPSVAGSSAVVPRSASADDGLTGFSDRRANVEPVLQCSHARSFVRAHQRATRR